MWETSGSYASATLLASLRKDKNKRNPNEISMSEPVIKEPGDCTLK